MNHIITTVDALFRSASTAINDATTDRLQDFVAALQEVSNNRDAISLFRTLHCTRIRLYAEFENRQQRMFTSVMGYINTELELLARYGGQAKPHATRFRWTGTVVELVEIIYAFDELRCIDEGEPAINELLAFFGDLFGMEIKNSHCYNAYADMKRRKNESRTYFLDKLRERLNMRMQRDDEKERARRR